MKTTVAGKTYFYVVTEPRLWAETAIVFPQAGPVALGHLAIDAIRKFTPESHAIWVSHDHRDSAPVGADVYVVQDTAVEKWWQPRINVAGHAAAVAYSLAVEAMRADPPKWVFFMHNDSLPLKSGWLSYLRIRARAAAEILGGASNSEHWCIAGVKRTEITKAAHSSGVLMSWHVVGGLSPVWPLAKLPDWDILEYPSVRLGAWTADSHCNREGDWRYGHWWTPFDCDVSFDDAGEPFFIHLGGGTVNRRRDVGAWVRAARANLSL